MLHLRSSKPTKLAQENLAANQGKRLKTCCLPLRGQGGRGNEVAGSGWLCDLHLLRYVVSFFVDLLCSCFSLISAFWMAQLQLQHQLIFQEFKTHIVHADCVLASQCQWYSAVNKITNCNSENFCA